jgi:hypothetical protein
MKKIKSLMRDFAISIVPPAAVFFLFMIRVRIMQSHRELDTMAHFLGGLSIAWMGIILWERWRKQKILPPKIPAIFRDYAILSHVAVIGVLWEFMEWWFDHYLGWYMQASLGDTMGDLSMDLLGGLAFVLIYRSMRRKFSISNS